MGSSAGLQPQLMGPAALPILAMASTFLPVVAYSQKPNQVVWSSSPEAFSVERDLWLQQML